MTFDPISHAAGIGAGQEAGQRRAHASELEAMRAKNDAEAAQSDAALARINANSAHESSMAAMIMLKMERDKNAALQNEIQNKWIPYGVRLKASIMAIRVERADLIEALKAGDPANADRIAQEAVQHRDGEYDRIANDPKAVGEVREVVLKEAEAGRLG